ncbi:LytR/AlgR family response regulator transcription factor [Paenibacillus arenilitoris]|uniref:Response regulator transcription factor n=1 Tax=Paenibacillus arenilitoris TaxID=2772299 RepID=A0A927H4Z8_9BACL|nr:LytTR family DNA-binding domain-containing protein [Paenibacillus arenilitoris]MBD2868023.1 response regulator transcription factor [Paenibacillus arenilitoris]
MDQEIRALIADDELYSRDELKHLLVQHADVRIAGEADNGESAVMKAISLQPDVVFLDIEMPGMSGMSAAKSLRELKKPPIIVFATAYSDYATEAFRYEAVDYLLKPYDEEQLSDTMQRIRKTLRLRGEGRDVGEERKRSGKLAVESADEIVYLEPKGILYVVFEDKASKIVTMAGEYSTKLPLKELERRLNAYHFYRVHKSYLVNTSYIKRLTPWFNGAYQLELEGVGDKLFVSRNYVKGLRARLEL